MVYAKIFLTRLNKVSGAIIKDSVSEFSHFTQCIRFFATIKKRVNGVPFKAMIEFLIEYLA